jgi:hypothetical protein
MVELVGPLNSKKKLLVPLIRCPLHPEPQGSGRRFQWLPRKLLSAAINLWVSRATDLELRADLVILENKQYLQKPGLAQGDGPIDTIRQWERQFYVSEDVDVVAGAG